MKYQPNRDYNSNDDVQTPEELAKLLVEYFNPQGIILEPCKGNGNILKFLPKDTLWCEIKEGHDFLDFNHQVDYIITNPPWSLVRIFLRHSMKISKDIVFLITVNHLWTKARLRDIEENKFGIKEILLVNMPKSFPQSGFQLGAIHLQKDYKGDIKLNRLNNVV